MAQEAAYVRLAPGDPAPWFQQKTSTNPLYSFSTVAGRYIVLLFFGSANNDYARAAIEAVNARAALFNDAHASFFGVSNDPADLSENRISDRIPGRRFFWDFNGHVARLYGALPKETPRDSGPQVLRRRWVILDPSLRVLSIIETRADGADIKAALDFVAALPHPDRHAGCETPAPIILLPRVFEPSFCKRMIDFYEASGGEESGFMREEGGKTVAAYDDAHKKRKDCLIRDQELVAEIQRRIMRRVAPEILKVHQFRVTRMERYVVGCYSSEDGGHFRPHRDNTTKGTAHRRFALSVLLNDDYEGGEISFPEYGSRGYKPAAGGAVVFSCSLLHKVEKVTAGRRFVFVPFLYDDEAARQREANNAFLSDEVGAYERKESKPDPAP